MLNGHHLIAGNWVAGATSFPSSPATGAGQAFANATPADVDRAVRAAEDAFWSYSALPRDTRAACMSIPCTLARTGRRAGRRTARPESK